jgi:spore coat-associated protein N
MPADTHCIGSVIFCIAANEYLGISHGVSQAFHPTRGAQTNQTMSDKKLELNRRRVLAGIGIIGAASAGAGAGTMALFSDTESSTGNEVKAGTLDLQAGGENPLSTSQQFGPLAPGEGGEMTVPLKNVGTLAGTLDFVFTGTSSEGDNPESESDTQGAGELGALLNVGISLGGDEVATGSFNDVIGLYENLTTLGASESTEMKIEWDLPSDAGNEVQGDVVSVNLNYFFGQDASQSPAQTFDVVAIKDTPGSGTVSVVGNLVQFDTSTLDDPASQWVSTENVGFWFGDGSGSSDYGTGSGKVELKWSPDGGWRITNNDSNPGAELSDFGFNLSGDTFTVVFDQTTYSEFGLYVEPENQEGNGAEQAVATVNDQKPWSDRLYNL